MHELLSSAAVLLELSQGEFPGKNDAIALISSLEPLVITREVTDVVSEYIARKLMPHDPRGDALHFGSCLVSPL